MQNETGQPLVYSVEAAGKMLGLSRPTSYRLAAEGVIPTIRLGRSLRVPRARLEALLAGDLQPKS